MWEIVWMHLCSFSSVEPVYTFPAAPQAACTGSELGAA